MSAVPRKRRKVKALASVAKGHGGSRRKPLQRPVMMVARCYGSIAWAALAFERGFPAITLDVHLQDGGVVHEPVDSRQRRGENLAPFAEGLIGRDEQRSAFVAGGDQLEQHAGLGLILGERRRYR